MIRLRDMATVFQIAELASHLGEPPRAAMLEALMDGRALTAGSLLAWRGLCRRPPVPISRD
jgi:hypothetical protein